MLPNKVVVPVCEDRIRIAQEYYFSGKWWQIEKDLREKYAYKRPMGSFDKVKRVLSIKAAWGDFTATKESVLFCAPDKATALSWQEFILSSTQHYIKSCNHVFGIEIHHTKSEDMEQMSRAAGNIEVAMAQTFPFPVRNNKTLKELVAGSGGSRGAGKRQKDRDHEPRERSVKRRRARSSG